MNDLPGIDALLADPLLADIKGGTREGLLILDYDGTLAPFQAKREQAVPYPAVTETLSRLPRRGPGRFVVVSGREAKEVMVFLGLAAPAEIWGCHGAQRQFSAGTPDVPTLRPQWETALRRAAASIESTAPAEALEKKLCSLALHWRGLDAPERQRLLRQVTPLWTALAKETGLILHSFDGGLELRPPGHDKGRAIHTLRRENPDAALVYLGDDLTDEDAFQALDVLGLGVLTRGCWRPTAARYRITPPGELLRFLDRWATAAERANL